MLQRPDFRFSLLLLLTGLAALPVVQAENEQTRGLAIATEADQRDTGFGDTAAALQMILRNRHGQETTRSMRSRTLEVSDDGNKSMIVFDEPADVRGTALLTFTHKSEPDDQWLYLPALKRVKRISSSNKSGPFMGSEFAYEDLGSQEVEKYEYRYLRDEACGELQCFVIERVPVDPKSGYTRQTVWLDQDEYRTLKVEYYDRKESLLKTLSMLEYEQYLERHWRPARMDMINHQTGKSTTLLWQDYQFGNGFEDSDFNRNSLAKAR